MLIHVNADGTWYYCTLVYTRDVNDAKPKLLVFDAEPILSFSEKKPGRAETLAKRARAELRL